MSEYALLIKRALQKHHEKYELTSVYPQEEKLPTQLKFDAIIIGGSIHSTYENLPWIKDLEQLIRGAEQKKIPLLGICFGHQIIAQALGGKVIKGHKGRESGIANINLTTHGQQDPLFTEVDTSFHTATSHADIVVELPNHDQIKPLASTSVYDYQALAIGNHVRTVQFHPEFDKENIKKLVSSRKEVFFKENFIQTSEQFEKLMEEIEEIEFEHNGLKIMENFFEYFVLNKS
jgi:GMP synthase-like glutamine amidotransferase